MTSIAKSLKRPPVHPFPARMAPGLIKRRLTRLDPGSVVLDPMSGSGTVLALARAAGHRAIGFDLDPLAVLMARVWTRPVDVREVRKASDHVHATASEYRRNLTASEAFPVGADEETREFVKFWFDGRARVELAALAQAIDGVYEASIREVLWCAFSRLIVTKSAGASRARDLAHSRPHRFYARSLVRPLAAFETSVSRVLAGVLPLSLRPKGPATRCEYGDARALPLRDDSVDLVLSSPPYLNAIDYLRCSKFSLVWMGYSVSGVGALRAVSIGSERAARAGSDVQSAMDSLNLSDRLPPRQWGMLVRYARDVSRMLGESARVLSKKGEAVFVIGENTLRGCFVPTSKLMTHLAGQAGLELRTRAYRQLPPSSRYLPPPSRGRSTMDVRMRREVVLTFGR